MINKFKAGDVVLATAGYECGQQGTVIKQIDTSETLGYNCYYEVLFYNAEYTVTKYEDYLKMVYAKNKLLYWLST